jgi:hypothetical protein
MLNIPVNGIPIVSKGYHAVPDHVMIDHMCANKRTHENFCVEGQWAHNYAKTYVEELVHDLADIPESDRPPLFLWSNFVEAHTAPRK